MRNDVYKGKEETSLPRQMKPIFTHKITEEVLEEFNWNMEDQL